MLETLQSNLQAMLETIFDKRFEILGLGTTWKSEELGRK